jgi:hypothetical protein
VGAVRDIDFGVSVIWKERSGWKTEGWSLGRYLRETGAVLFGIDMVGKSLVSILSEVDHRCAGIVTKSRLALTGI